VRKFNTKEKKIMLLELQPEFDELLQPFGNHAVEFFLAASLYHARKISFASAAHIAGLSFEEYETSRGHKIYEHNISKEDREILKRVFNLP
jgi:predicted HTH domain antitoxin